MALCFRYREAMTAGHDAVTFKGMIVKTAVALLMALVSMAAHAETFKGYQCTQDCSGHKAGYAWAQRLTRPLHLPHLVIERPHVGRSRRVNALEGFLVVDAL